jgi:hypothetical protein
MILKKNLDIGSMTQIVPVILEIWTERGARGIRGRKSLRGLREIVVERASTDDYEGGTSHVWWPNEPEASLRHSVEL